MQFCSGCGSVLNIFEFPDEELCYSCRKLPENEPKVEQTISAEESNFSVDSLKDAVLSHENDQFILRSPEGWVLWSAPDTTNISFGKIVARAETILKIRQRRKNK